MKWLIITSLVILIALHVRQTWREIKMVRRNHDQIREQMDFWHAEKMRELKAAHSAWRAGDHEAYDRHAKAFNVANARYEMEVTDKLYRTDSL